MDVVPNGRIVGCVQDLRGHLDGRIARHQRRDPIVKPAPLQGIGAHRVAPQAQAWAEMVDIALGRGGGGEHGVDLGGNAVLADKGGHQRDDDMAARPA